MLKYITLAELCNTIRKNIYKIPRDIDFIIGIPRSGMIAASIISDYLNIPLIDINAFLVGVKPYGGIRLYAFKQNTPKYNKALVIDDTIYTGNSMRKVKERLQEYIKINNVNIDFLYGACYLEGNSENMIDLYLEDVRQYTNNFLHIILYEWNIFHHYAPLMEKCLYDIDGVFCVEPPDERNEKEYLEYIANATPLFIPSSKIGGIMTYRLVKNKDITVQWLAKQGIKYNQLFMFNAMSYEERQQTGVSSEQYKGFFYKNNNKYQLFVESSDWQAQRICEISRKPVYCTDSNKLYQLLT